MGLILNFYWVEKTTPKKALLYFLICVFFRKFTPTHKLVAWVQNFVSCFWRKWSQMPIPLSNTQCKVKIHPRWLFGTFDKCTKKQWARREAPAAAVTASACQRAVPLISHAFFSLNSSCFSTKSNKYRPSLERGDELLENASCERFSTFH